MNNSPIHSTRVNGRSKSGDSQELSATESPPRGAARWLAFLPSLLIFITVACGGGGSGGSRLELHDELIAAGFISAFVALLWVFSRRLAGTPTVRPSSLRPAVRGFEVVIKPGGDSISR